MGKWNKAAPQVSQQFLQNQQRRKQMIIQAAKRRKQKQKKLQQQAQIQKKNQQQALLKHKQQKKDAYVKYLRNNMHDKYQQIKRNQKLNQPQVRSKSKWKKDSNQSQIKNQNNLEGLNLEVNIPNNKILHNKIINKVGGQVVRNVPDNKNQKYQKNLQSQNYGNWNNHKKQQKLITKPQSAKRRMIQDQFQNMWKQEHEEQQKQIDYDLSVQQTIFDDMMGSKLLDSLDLDLDTVTRGKRLDKKIKQQKTKQSKPKQNKQIDQIKNMIGYESVLMSIDERSQMIKKYNQFMKNQVQEPKQREKNKLQQPIKNFSKQKYKNQKDSKSTINPKQSKPLNQGQVFNQLKNKKQGKILNWAQGQAQQADDLFSNCSTNKKSKTRGFELLKQINKQIQQKNKKPTSAIIPNNNISNQQVNMKKKQKPLETIPQKKINSSLQRLRQRSYDKKIPTNQPQSMNLAQNNQNKSHQIRRSVSKQKVNVTNNSRPNRMNSGQNRSGQPPIPPRNISRQKASKTATNSFKQNNDSSSNINIPQPRPRTNSHRTLSKQKQVFKSSKQITNVAQQSYSKNIPLKQQNTVSSARQIPNLPTNTKKLPHLPPSYQRPMNNVDQVTIATQDQVFEVQSFIKNQLLCLNKQQRQLQQQLKNIHIQNKQKIKQVQKKYQIKTDYKYSYQIRQKQQGQNYQQEDNQTNNSYQKAHKRQTQDQLQQSIQRLDDMLLRKQILNKQKNSRITQQDNQSQSTHRSIINPMCDPITLHKQVLQLAQNLSRFQGQPEDPNTGYGAKLRMKKKSVQKQNKSAHKRPQSVSQKRQTQIELSQSQDVNFSQLNSVQAKQKISKVSKPPQLQYSQQGNCGIPPGYNQSGLLDDQDQLQDSIQKGKIQVNQRLRRMLLQ